MGAALTVVSSPALFQSTRVVHPTNEGSVSLPRVFGTGVLLCVDGELTLMIDLRKVEWVAPFVDTLPNHVGGNRLQGEGHVGARERVNRHCSLPPECIDVFVQLRIDLGGRAAIIVTFGRVSPQISLEKQDEIWKCLTAGGHWRKWCPRSR